MKNASSLSPANGTADRLIAAAAIAPGDSCGYGSQEYFLLCGLDGILSWGITHTMVVSLDLVKCHLQVDVAKYKNLFNGFRVTVQEEGLRGLAKGWAPTFYGYSMQGACKFGLLNSESNSFSHKFFKVIYSDILGEENSYLWRTSLYLAASASAEYFANIALCPMEAVKVKIQTSPGFANTMRDDIPKMHGEEGMTVFFK